MNIEKLPTLAAFDHGMLRDPGRPVISFEWQTSGPHRVGAHSHPRAQIIYQRTGVYRVVTDDGSFIVPPRQAIWIPPWLFHETFSNDSTQSLMLFVDDSLAGNLAGQCMVVDVDPFLAQLFLRTVQYGNDYDSSGKEARLVQIIIDELGSLTPAPMRLPLASDKRLRRVIDRLIADPSQETLLSEMALGTGASSRTLARLFVRETGMTFLQWRNRLRLQEAIDQLDQGRPVTDVAMDMGYQSVSAFIAMFRREMGVSPARYARQRVPAEILEKVG